MRRNFTILAAALVLSANGCSQGDSNTEPRASAHHSTPSSADAPSGLETSSQNPAATRRRIDPRRDGLEVGFGEFAVTLEAETIRPGDVTFVVRNEGKLVHGFEIKVEELDSDGESAEDDFEREAPEFGPGETMRIPANLAPGIYEIECHVANHEELGMRALLHVRPNAPLVKLEATPDNLVNITGFAFRPETITIRQGTKLTWANEDPTEHTVTASDNSFGSDPLPRGATFATRLDRLGSFAYYCAIHPAMKARVQVVN